MEDLITQEEIDIIKSRVVELSCFKSTTVSNIKPIIPYSIKSGYKIGYSIDVFPDNKKFHHISISKINKSSDPADEEIIIEKILGKGYKKMGSFFNKDVTHYNKEI